MDLDADMPGVRKARLAVDQSVLPVGKEIVPDPDPDPGRLTLYPDPDRVIFIRIPEGEPLEVVQEKSAPAVRERAVKRGDLAGGPEIYSHLVMVTAREYAQEKAAIQGPGSQDLGIKFVIRVLFIGNQEAAFALRVLIADYSAVYNFPRTGPFAIHFGELVPAIESLAVEQGHETGKIRFFYFSLFLRQSGLKKTPAKKQE
jgi:hypothetical protein